MARYRGLESENGRKCSYCKDQVAAGSREILGGSPVAEADALAVAVTAGSGFTWAAERRVGVWLIFRLEFPRVG
jgi:hypothetical protein